MKLTFEELTPKHSELINRFECDDEPSVALFLREEALNYHQLNMAKTRLYFDENHNLVGFFTVLNDLFELSNRQKVKHKYYNFPPYRFFPAIKLHYLGIDRREREKGYGRYLLLEALDLACEISEKTGCLFMTLESLPSAIGFYYHHNFRKQNKNGHYLNMFYKLDEL